MEHLMVEKPGHWQKYYRGDPHELRLQRHFSYSIGSATIGRTRPPPRQSAA